MSVEERKPHVLLLAIRVKFSELMRCVASLVFKRGIRAERQELRLCVTVSASSSLMASATPMVCRFYPVARHTRSHQCIVPPPSRQDDDRAIYCSISEPNFVYLWGPARHRRHHSSLVRWQRGPQHQRRAKERGWTGGGRIR